MKFLSQARKGSNHPGLYVFLTAVVFISYFVAQLIIPAVTYWTAVVRQGVSTDDYTDALISFDLEVLHISKNQLLLMLMMMFILSMIAFYLLFPKIHNRDFRSVLTTRDRLDFKRIFFAFGLWIALGFLAEMVLYSFDSSGYTFTSDWSTFWPLLLIAIFILPIQTSFEEIFFRGYLMQGFYLIFEKYGIWAKMAPLLITSVLFALVHGANPETAQYGTIIMLLNYFSAAVFLGVLVLMDEGLELALGVHWATNFYAACFVGYEGAALDTNSIAKLSTIDPYKMLIVLIISGIVFVLICSYVYRFNPLSKLLNTSSYTVTPKDKL